MQSLSALVDSLEHLASLDDSLEQELSQMCARLASLVEQAEQVHFNKLMRSIQSYQTSRRNRVGPPFLEERELQAMADILTVLTPY